MYKPVVGVEYHAGRPLTMSTKAHARRASQLAGGGLMRKLVKQVLFISQKVFIKSFCRIQFPHKPVYLSFKITIVKNQLADLYGN